MENTDRQDSSSSNSRAMTATREHTDSLAARRQAQAQAQKLSTWLGSASIVLDSLTLTTFVSLIQL